MISYTGDAVTDANLTRLKAVCSFKGQHEPRHAETLQTIIVMARRMLPDEVKRHFFWPVGWTRLGNHDTTAEAVRAWIDGAVQRLEDGLEAVLKDPALARAASPRLTRPVSRGEQAAEAAAALMTRADKASWGHLRDVLAGTELEPFGKAMEKALLRNDRRGFYRELSRIDSAAWTLHFLPATGH